jgi:thiamine-monophosphate kinase
MTDLGPGAEFDAIRELVARWGPRARGIGDDAAVVDVPRGDQLVVSTDAAVEGRHFRREWLTAREIGYRAVTAALSDLAAMAASPLGVLVALAVPPDWRSDLAEIADGIGDAVTIADTVILGGNLSSATELSLTTTVLGHARAPLTRAGARVGDLIYVTGTLGDARAALAAFERGALPVERQRARFATPRARVREARWLANAGGSAAIDISDGLSSELGHLAAASRALMVLDLATLPCAPGIEPSSALASGEEYELVVCTPRAFDCDAFVRTFGLSLTLIGRVESGEAGVAIRHGLISDITSASGHDHFSS